MNLLRDLKREFLRRRFESINLFCGMVLIGLCVAAFLPRTWTSCAVLELDPAQDPKVRERLEASLAEGVDSPAGDSLGTALVGGKLTLKLRSTSADRAFEQLSLLLAAAARAERDRKRQSLVEEVARLQIEAARADDVLARASARLEAHRLGMADEAEALLTARIVRVESEISSLGEALNLNQDSTSDYLKKARDVSTRMAALQPTLDAPASFDRRIAAVRAELGARRSGSENRAHKEELELELSRLEVERLALSERKAQAEQLLNHDLQPELIRIQAKLVELEQDSAQKTSARQRAIVLVDALRSEADGLHRSNQPLQDLERQFDSATAEDLRVRAALQAAKDASVVAASTANQAFRVEIKPSMPSRSDGHESWVSILISLAAASLGSCVYVGWRSRVGLRATSGPASEGGIGSEPAWIDHQTVAVGGVRPSAVAAAILLVIMLSAVALFLVESG